MSQADRLKARAQHYAQLAARALVTENHAAAALLALLAFDLHNTAESLEMA